MHKLVAALAVSSTLVLGGCGTTGGFDPKPVADYIIQAQQLATKICGFVPDPNVITNLIPILGSIDAVVSSICHVMANPTAVRGGRPTVAGVRITGHFVRRR